MDTQTAAATLASAHKLGATAPDKVFAAVVVMIACHRTNWLASLKVAVELKREGADAAEIAEWQGYARESREAMQGLQAFKMLVGTQWVTTGRMNISAPPVQPNNPAVIASRCEVYRECGHYPA